MPTYKTPNVYVEEISKFPPSVAAVATAVPAFIGYTERAEKNGSPVSGIPIRIKSLLEYERFFGFGKDPSTIRIDLTNQNTVSRVVLNAEFYLYDSVRMFYANGGGNCYVVSVGNYDDSIDQAGFIDGIDTLLKEDEPTILLFPDAVKLTNAQLGTVQKHALAQCKNLKDRVALLDVKFDDPILTEIEVASKNFRDNIGVLNLDYGATYLPYIETTLPFTYSYENIEIFKNNLSTSLTEISPDSTIVDGLERVLDDINDQINPFVNTPNLLFPAPFNAAPYLVPVSEGYNLIPLTNNKLELTRRATYIRAILETFLNLGGQFTDITNITAAPDERNLDQMHSALIDPADNSGISNPADFIYPSFETYLRTLLRYDTAYAGTAVGETSLGAIATTDFDASALFEDYDGNLTNGTPIDVTNLYTGTTVASRVASARFFFQRLYENALSLVQSFVAEAQLRAESLEDLLAQTNPVYSKIVAAIAEEGVILPPSGAMAGVYATVDNTRGVYKAPANVSLNAVIGPAQKIDNNIQDDLNVDVNAGKSINAIRAFTGKGTLVWGARTLAGNSNEWRYINVRRFFNFAEESIKKATEPFVFEPNDANTWAKVKSMIINFLTLQWRDGALQGAKPEHAFYVKIGLGETMTALDILEGRLIVEVGMAVVRPAEFIILRFSHKLPES